jgi:glycosyltransferase involved in cell wall biosynthesis
MIGRRKRIVGVDASRNRSGGAKAHIIGIMSAVDPQELGIDEVHVWSYSELLSALPDRPWLIKHCPAELSGSMFRQLWWQRFRFPKELRANGCNVLLTTDAGSVCRFSPSVVMSRDMLSFEPGEIDRYWFSKAWLRLLLLRYMQVSSLRHASGALFLTQYAAEVIQKFSGQLETVRVIPHGIGENFRMQRPTNVAVTRDAAEPLKCVYVSNADLYKHQWHVIEAIRQLRDDGHNLTIELVGAGGGPASAQVFAAIEKFDPNGKFATVTPGVPHHLVPSFLSKADIFIFASSCENMPNTLIEAMACGLPIACSARGPMPEILQNAGEYFDPEKPESIAAAIAKLTSDATARGKFALEAKQLSEHFSWKRCATETLSFLVDIADVHQSARLIDDTNLKVIAK